MSLLLGWILSSVSIFLTSRLVKGFEVASFGSAMIASIVVGLFNMTLRPILLILTFPVNFLTLGLFTFVVNAIVLRVSAGFLKNFTIQGWGPAIIGAFILAIINLILFGIFPG